MNIDKQRILDHFAGDFTPFYARHLGAMKRSGNSFKALCRFHDDNDPSLFFWPETGKFKCYGCEAHGDIFDFYARTHRLNGDFAAVVRGIDSDFAISGNGVKSEKATIRKDKERLPAERKRLVEVYEYLNLQGVLQFQKVRYEPKSFRLRRPDGRGGWIYNLEGIEEPVLYNVAAAAAADEVFFVEGEKDCEKLKAVGIVATTIFNGASGKWLEPYTQILTGKRLVLIPDADEPGRALMQRVAAAMYGVAASIKILNLPNPASKKGYDVSDFIADQVDLDTAAEKLSIMVEGAPEWPLPAELELVTEPSSGFQFIHNAEILADLKPIEWRIRDILTDYSLYYNFGDPGHFKTFIELDRLLCIASGIDYHGHKVKQGTVFYICGEGWQGIGRRIAAWHIAHGTKAPDVPFFVSRTPTQLMDREAIQEVRRAVDSMAKVYGPPAVVHIDTLARNFGEGDENATKDMNAAISNLDRAFGADFCRGLTHHTGHANKDRARGAMALHGAADGAFRISLTASGQIVAECKKMKDAPTAPMMVFDRREILLRIGDTEDRSYVMELEAEGDDATAIYKPKAQAKLKAGLAKAVGILRNLQDRFQENLRKNGRPFATPQILYAEWRDACKDAGLYKRTDHFRRAFESILLTGIVGVDESKRFVYLKEILSEIDE